MGGIGLHTGEYAYVRVRPAFAGEGRYFVRVPEGTNSDLFELREPNERGIEELGADYSEAANDSEIESLRLQLFQAYLKAQEEGFKGAFADFVESVDFARKEEVLNKLGVEDAMKDNWTYSEPEEIAPKHELQEGLPWWPAIAETAQLGMPLTQILKSYRPPSSSSEGEDKAEEEEEVRPEGSIQGAQLLLSALEAMGVDNARIEIEGGCEVPVLDGSALGWALEVQFAGLRPAPPQGTPHGTPLEQVGQTLSYPVPCCLI
jgi:UDP-3-O-[3-hydroxymyristoyl] N-acetylglucosamine deacetylase